MLWTPKCKGNNNPRNSALLDDRMTLTCVLIRRFSITSSF